MMIGDGRTEPNRTDVSSLHFSLFTLLYFTPAPAFFSVALAVLCFALLRSAAVSSLFCSLLSSIPLLFLPIRPLPRLPPLAPFLLLLQLLLHVPLPRFGLQQQQQQQLATAAPPPAPAPLTRASASGDTRTRTPLFTHACYLTARLKMLFHFIPKMCSNSGRLERTKVWLGVNVSVSVPPLFCCFFSAK